MPFRPSRITHRISKILFALGANEFLAMLEVKIGEAPFFKVRSGKITVWSVQVRGWQEWLGICPHMLLADYAYPIGLLCPHLIWKLSAGHEFEGKNRSDSTGSHCMFICQISPRTQWSLGKIKWKKQLTNFSINLELFFKHLPVVKSPMVGYNLNLNHFLPISETCK